MDFKDIVRMALDEYLAELRTALSGLTPEERRFQPTADAHHIDFAVWHMARVEDGWLHSFAIGDQQLWQKDGWSQKFGIPERDSGFGYTSEQLANLPQFDIDDIMAYYDSVRQETLRYLDGLTVEELARCPNEERRPGYSIGNMFSHIIVEESQHVGQIAYIRGIQRGLNK